VPNTNGLGSSGLWRCFFFCFEGVCCGFGRMVTVFLRMAPGAPNQNCGEKSKSFSAYGRFGD